MLFGGIALVTVGAIILGWLAWQFWGTNWVSKGRQADVIADLHEDWGDGNAAADTDFGKATGILRIPRFGADYEVPILEGSSDEVLAAGVGHLEDSAAVGEHGNPFADFPELREGDLVHVETLDADYTYVLDTGGPDLTVPFTASWVLDPFPVNPDAGSTTAPGRPGARLITLVTCSELFHTDNRMIAFGHLVRTTRP
jgi:sortase A